MTSLLLLCLALPGAVLEVEVHPQETYRGGQIVYTVRLLYQIYPLNPPRFNLPDFNGFKAYYEEPRSGFETRGGRELRFDGVRVILIPEISGELVIPPPEAIVDGERLVGREVRIVSREPPPSISVGRWAVSAGISSEKLPLRSPARLEVRVVGYGDPDSPPGPILNPPPGLSLSRAEVKSKCIFDERGLRSEVTYVYELRGERPGLYEIPPIRVRFFDPEEGEIEEERSEPIRLEVIPAPSPPFPEIKRRVDLGDHPKPLPLRGWFIAVQSLPLLFLIASSLLRRSNRIRMGIATRRLSAELSSAGGDPDAVLKALYGFIGRLTGRTPSSPEEAETVLGGAVLSPEAIEGLVEAIRRAEEARFSPSRSIDPSIIFDRLKHLRLTGRRRELGAALLFAVLSGGMGPERLFEEGNRLYDMGDYWGAMARYEALLREIDHPALRFNLALVYLRLGDPGRAIFHLERARMMAPGDEGIERALEYVRSAWGLEGRRSRRGWIWSAVITCYWLSCAALGVWIWFGRREWLWIGAALGLLCLGIGLSALLGPGEAVVIERTALKALPLESSPMLVPLKPGQVIEVEDERNGWVKASIGSVEGWVRCEAVEFLSGRGRGEGEASPPPR